jgi:hypothetical protein
MTDTDDTTIPDDKLGWYDVHEVWQLFENGRLRERFVQEINVSQQAHGDEYVVEHYGPSGLITTLTLPAGDVWPEIQDRETVRNPVHTSTV